MLDIVDQGLSDVIMKCIHIGLLCVQKAESRPTMHSHCFNAQCKFLHFTETLATRFFTQELENHRQETNHIASFNSVTISELDPS